MIAGVNAADSALPDPSVDRTSAPARRWSPSRCPGPRPSCTWKLGPPAGGSVEMSLKLTDVAGVTVDATAAKFPTGTDYGDERRHLEAHR